jgi:hypothetical protein
MALYAVLVSPLRRDRVQIWSDTICYDAAGWRYVPGLGMSNKELLDVTSPVASYVWHDRYQGARGPQTGGMLLETWLRELEAAESELTECQKSRTDCRGAWLLTPTTSLLS